MNKIALVTCLLVLSGCVTATRTIAPRPIAYSREFQAATAEELGRINAPHVEQMITDYGRERAKLRALEK